MYTIWMCGWTLGIHRVHRIHRHQAALFDMVSKYTKTLPQRTRDATNVFVGFQRVRMDRILLYGGKFTPPG